MYVDYMGPHYVESFMDFFKYNFYAWSQLFGEYEKQIIPLYHEYVYENKVPPHLFRVLFF